MPTIVHPHDAFTGTDFAEEQTWAGTKDAYVGVPYRRNTIHQEWTTDPDSEEFGAFGAVKSAGYRQKRALGEIEVEARVDAPWFHRMAGNAFGEEKLTQDKWLDDSAATNVNTHWYLFNATRPSAASRKHVSGPTNAGSVEEATGLKSSGFRFEFPRDGGVPFFIFRYLGKQVSRLAESTNTIVTPVGSQVSGGRMLSNAQAFFKTGTFGGTVAARNVHGFSIDVNIPLVSDEAFLNDPTASLEPGVSGTRTVEFEIVASLEQGFFADGMPYEEYINAKFSQLDVILTTGTDIIANKPWGIRFNIPKVQWRLANDPIENAGEIILTLQGRAVESATATPNTGATDMRMGVAVKNDSTGDSDTYMSARTVHS